MSQGLKRLPVAWPCIFPPGFRAVPDPTFTWARPASLAAASGKRVVVIGGTGGLGRELALASAKAGADVTVVGRSFRDGPTSSIKFIRADLESMKEASRVGAELAAQAPWDTVVLTTGIISAPKREATAEGIERDLAVSYLSRLAILDVLAPRLAETSSSKPPRVFVMGFPGVGEAGMLGDLNAEKEPYEQFKVCVVVRVCWDVYGRCVLIADPLPHPLTPQPLPTAQAHELSGRQRGPRPIHAPPLFATRRLLRPQPGPREHGHPRQRARGLEKLGILGRRMRGRPLLDVAGEVWGQDGAAALRARADGAGGAHVQPGWHSDPPERGIDRGARRGAPRRVESAPGTRPRRVEVAAH